MRASGTSSSININTLITASKCDPVELPPPLLLLLSEPLPLNEIQLSILRYYY